MLLPDAGRTSDAAIPSAAAWAALEAAVGTESASRSVPASLLDDPTGRHAGSAAAVVRPRNATQVQAVVRIARAHRLRLVPRGGGTSLAGGAVPQRREVVLDLTRLTQPLTVDAVERTVTAGAGLTLAQVQQALAEHGLRLPLELGSSQSATIGGIVATNAGGTQVLRHGHARHLLLGVEAVLGTGELIRRLNGWRKDNNGPDLSALLCGSEGTLAVITAATFRVTPVPTGPSLLLGVLVRDWSEVVQVALIARDVPSVHAVEMVSDRARALLRDLPALRTPYAGLSGHLLLVALDGPHAMAEAEHLVPRLEARGAQVVVAADPVARESLWATRHAVAEAIRRQGTPHKLDLAVPLGRMSEFLSAAEALVAQQPEAQAVPFGHVADGNVHINVLGADPCLLDSLVALVTSHGGHASAEHGIGVDRAQWLPLTRSPAELELLEALRRVFDPQGVLNARVFRGESPALDITAVPSAPSRR